MKKFALILIVTMLFGCHHHYKHKHKKPIKQQVKQATPAPQPIQEIEVKIEPKQEIVEPEPFLEPEQPKSWWF
jgi:outer membrane lipopolysaccharide assembly protein LptE/RlpB